MSQKAVSADIIPNSAVWRPRKCCPSTHDQAIRYSRRTNWFQFTSVFSSWIYRPSCCKNKPKTIVINHWKRMFWACFRENWVYYFRHCTVLFGISLVRLCKYCTEIFLINRQCSNTVLCNIWIMIIETFLKAPQKQKPKLQKSPAGTSQTEGKN